MKRLLCVTFYLLIIFLPFQANGNEFIAVTGCRDVGLFSVFKSMLNLLTQYEKGIIQGVQINFGTTGLYYDSKYGANWWEYYFEPLCVGDQKRATIVFSCEDLSSIHYVKIEDLRKNNHSLIQKYIRLKPHLQNKIKTFMAKDFQGNFIIGVHYRGTDKDTESARIDYKIMLQKISNQIKKLSPKKQKKYKIFVATDEIQFLELMLSQFPGKVCYNSDIPRSSNGMPLHIDPNRNPYMAGEGAIIDCILLSKTNILIRTNSNLSECSCFFNPVVPSLLISAQR